MMRDTVARRLIQFGLLMVAEGLFFSNVLMPWYFQLVVSAALAVLLVRHWRRAEYRPRRRKRVGPPMEWID